MNFGEMDGTLQIVHYLVEENSKTAIALQRPLFQATKIYNLTKYAPA